jgi:hypothetical protein
MRLRSIGIDTQIEDCLFGESDNDKESVQMKIDFTKKHLDEIILINGKKPYCPIVIGEHIYYFLSKPPDFMKITDDTGRKYYYPIKYADIQFFDNKP